MDTLTWDWNVLREAAPELLAGAVVTFLMAGAVIVAGSLAGGILGLSLSGPSRLCSAVAAVLLAPLRLLGALPAVLLLLVIQHVLPAGSSWLHAILARLAGAALPHVSRTEQTILEEIARRPFATAVVALTIVLAARVADSVRRGARQVPAHRLDVARSLGLGPVARFRRVLLPETFRASVLELGEAYLATIRHTALAFIIGCGGLLGTAWSIAETRGHHTELLATVVAAYLALLVPAIFLLRGVARSRWRQR